MTTDQFSHLGGDTAPMDVNTVQALVQLADLFKTLKKDVEDKEAALKEAKKSFNKVSMEEIPQALLVNGVRSIVLEDGSTVAVAEKISASVADQLQFADFLTDRGDEAILKTTLELGKVPPEILQKIVNVLADTYGLYPEVKQSVHTQTLAKYVKELCGIGTDKPAIITLADLPEGMLSTFLYYKTTIK